VSQIALATDRRLQPKYPVSEQLPLLGALLVFFQGKDNLLFREFGLFHPS
jgi:hypothetical protein